ncbi:MAG TPA: YihY/virulence factor BrkB family protein [Tepidisphaeraceae bacterium]|jgi:membrane protein
MRDWMGRFGVRGARWQGLLVETFAGWWEDRAPRLGAALAYYTVLSLAPLLVLVTPVASAMLGNTGKARSEIRQQFAQLLGDQGAKAVDDVLSAAGTRYGTPSPAARAISWIVLLFGASGVFAELQEALDTIWEVVPRPGSAAWLAILRKRFLSFAMVLGICFLLLVSLVVSAVLSSLRHYADQEVQGLATTWRVLSAIASVGVSALFFAMIYKILPDVTIRWRDVWIGALITAGLFTLGRFLIGEYLGKSSIGDRYGATGSLVVVLVWVYFSAQILYLGAEFTKAYSRMTRAPVEPEPIAIPITEEARARQGIPHKEVVAAVEEVIEQREQKATEKKRPG